MNVDPSLFIIAVFAMLAVLFVVSVSGWCWAASKADEWTEIEDERRYLDALAKSVGPVRDGHPARPSRRAPDEPARRRARLERQDQP